MRINRDFLREIDPRKSYDRGPMSLPAGALPHTTPGLLDPGSASPAGASRIGTHMPSLSSWTRPEMSDSVRDLSSMSLDELRRELKRREDAVARLQEKRVRIVAELAMVEAEIRRCGGEAALATGMPGLDGEDSPASSPRNPTRTAAPRPKNSLSLTDALTAAVDAGTVVSPTEASELVRKNGYLTNSKTFVQTVTVALSKHSGFKRVERGRYECIR